MNTKTKEGTRNKGNPSFLRVPWNKGGLVNMGPGTEGNSPALLRLRCVTKGERGTVLVLTASAGTPCRKNI